MAAVMERIRFPYRIKGRIDAPPSGKPLAIFFGTDFYNLPAGSNLLAYAKATNRMLAYMRERLPDYELLYLPHPNEKDELTHLDLTGFRVEEQKTIGELYLYAHPDRVRFVFSSCSWASGSAHAMGYRAGVFLHLLRGAIPDEAITGYESYFRGFPESFFIRDFSQELPAAAPARAFNDEEAERALTEAATPDKGRTAWFLASDPAYGLRASLLARALHARGIRTGLVRIRHGRWRLPSAEALLSSFDDVQEVGHGWYTARPWQLPPLLDILREVRALPLRPGDTLTSFAHMQFAENALLSYAEGVRKILVNESRWYHFSYEENGAGLPKERFHRSMGVRFFNAVFEPLCGLYRSGFEEYADGKVLNFMRYQAPLSRIYDRAFVLVPPIGV